MAYLVERYDLNIPESVEYDTLAGWILLQAGAVPEQGTVLEEGPFRLTVVQVNHGRIDLVKLEVTDPDKGYLG